MQPIFICLYLLVTYRLLVQHYYLAFSRPLLPTRACRCQSVCLRSLTWFSRTRRATLELAISADCVLSTVIQRQALRWSTVCWTAPCNCLMFHCAHNRKDIDLDLSTVSCFLLLLHTQLVKKDQRYFPFITLPSVNRFSKFFHSWIQQEIYNKTLVTFPTTH